jgi:hypothetical protein
MGAQKGGQSWDCLLPSPLLWSAPPRAPPPRSLVSHFPPPPQPPPSLTPFAGISDGDTVTVVFTKPTQAPPVASMASLLTLVSFPTPPFLASLPGREYVSGRWVANNTQLVITLLDTRGVSVLGTRIGNFTMGVTGVRDATGLYVARRPAPFGVHGCLLAWLGLACVCVFPRPLGWKRAW